MAALVVTVVVVGAGTAAAAVLSGLLGRVDTVGAVEFDRPLPVPPVAQSRVDVDGTRVVELPMQVGRADPSGRGATETWGVAGDHLAPTVRLERGERVRMEVSNGLPVASNLHWHGVHLPPESDGGPHHMVAPGGTWSPSWTVDQPATTAWYHPHGHGTTADHVRRGVYGMLLVDDPAAALAGLPDTYGVDDVPVMLQDAALGRDGALGSPLVPRPVGPLGDELLVNGIVGPYLDVTTGAVRLRLLNASASRVYDLALDDGRQVDLVGTDGGLLPAPLRVDSVLLSPGERAEVVVRLEPGERVVLRSLAPDTGSRGVMIPMSGSRDTFDVLELRAAESLAPSPELPATLAERPVLPADAEPSERMFVLADNDINGETTDMARVDQVVPTGTTERWVVRNEGGMPHSFHVHGTGFLVDRVDGASPTGQLTGWKDTVLVPPGGAMELLVRFDGPGDPDTPYMFHCHLLAHHDQGMMGQLLAVDPGQEPAATITPHQAHERRDDPVAGSREDRAAAMFPAATFPTEHPADH